MNAFLQNAQIDIEIDVQLRQILNQIKEKSLDANVNDSAVSQWLSNIPVSLILLKRVQPVFYQSEWSAN